MADLLHPIRTLKGRDEPVLLLYRQEPNTVVMHIRMLDKTAQLQQEAVGVLGINLIHACFTMGDNTAAIIGCLLEELNRARVEVSANFVSFFSSKPCRACSLALALLQCLKIWAVELWQSRCAL